MTELKEIKISKKDLMNLKEEDLMFITNPGRMGDEDGSSFVIKKDNSYIEYRVDGWAYPNKDDNETITIDDMFKVFPKWEEAWKNFNKGGYSGKYVYIYMGFGNGLCIDKSIYNKYLPYLKEAVINDGWEIQDDPSKIDPASGDACPGVAGVWEQALVDMMKGEK